MAYKLVKNIVPSSKYPIKATYSMTPTRIVVHNTANDASARNEIAYMIRNNNYTSFHYAVDDKEVVQGLPLNRNGWHAGDGGSGKGNRQGIGIEICYSKSGGARFTAAEKNAAILVAKLLKERGWGISKVTKHQDYSGKYCPHRTLDRGWSRFIKMIQAERDKLEMYNGKTARQWHSVVVARDKRIKELEKQLADALVKLAKAKTPEEYLKVQDELKEATEKLKDAQSRPNLAVRLVDFILGLIDKLIRRLKR